MPAATQKDIEIVLPRPCLTVLGRLLATVVIATPLVAMLFPELNHRSGDTPSKSLGSAATARPAVERPQLNPFAVRRSDP
jgi:hypothetical protein